jgi:uncharacterized membrane protein YfcA
LTLLIAAIIVFCFTAILTVAGVGAAFGVIPFLYWLGFQLKEATATALLLNCLSMSFASWKQELSIGLRVGFIAPDISVQHSGGRCGFWGGY